MISPLTLDDDKDASPSDMEPKSGTKFRIAQGNEFDQVSDKNKLNEMLETHSRKRLTLSKTLSIKKPKLAEKFKQEEKELMKRVARAERGNSELDTHDLPIGDIKVDWRYFNADVYSTDRKWTEVAEIAENNKE